MSFDDVHPNEMIQPNDFDDNETEALLSGAGHDLDGQLEDLLGDLRVACRSMPLVADAELSAFIDTRQPAPAQSRVSQWLQRARASMLTKFGAAAAAALLAATGGLAAAHALPAPVQDAVSHLGIGKHTRHDFVTPPAKNTTSTTVDPAVTAKPGRDTSKNLSANNHPGVAPEIAHDDRLGGCDGGIRLASCETPATVDDNGEMPTTVDDHGETPTTGYVNPGATSPGDTSPVDDTPSDVHEATPTTTADETTPTAEPSSDASDPGASKGSDSAPSVVGGVRDDGPS